MAARAAGAPVSVKPTLILFARAPRMGQVKRRLASGVGAVRALAFQRANLDATLRALRDPRWRLVIAVTPDRARLVLPGAKGLARIDQGPGDLGARMARALFSRAPAAIIGGDIPGITRAHVASAFAALRRADVVLGPSGDGGYWLIASRRGARPIPLSGIRWSSPHARADTIARVAPARVALIARLDDVDEAGDLDALKRRQRGRRADAPRAGA